MKLKTIVWLCLFCLIGVQNSFASEESKPFADKRIVLQISDSNPFKQTLVLNVASNLIKAYGNEKVDVEIVAFGPGLRLLFSNNANLQRIKNLSQNNAVQFSACKNTIANMGQKLGHPPELNQFAVPVSAGVVRILNLLDKGYQLVKP